MGNIINIFLIIPVLLCWFFIIRKLIWNRFACVKSVKAEVIDKYEPELVSKYPRTFKSKRYIVVFKTEDKRLSFDVSGFSYGNYKIKEKGTLRYKGNQIISFE